MIGDPIDRALVIGQALAAILAGLALAAMIAL